MLTAIVISEGTEVLIGKHTLFPMSTLSPIMTLPMWKIMLCITGTPRITGFARNDFFANAHEIQETALDVADMAPFPNFMPQARVNHCRKRVLFNKS